MNNNALNNYLAPQYITIKTTMFKNNINIIAL